jgi:uncharacterized protein (TIGR03382 family)
LRVATVFVFIVGSPAFASAVTIDTVPVGNPGNPADIRYIDGFHPNGVGAVARWYNIGKTEVTNAQYTEFLNSVGSSDPFALYNTSMDSSPRGGIIRSGSLGNFSYAVKADAVGQGPGGTDYTYGDKPVVFVSWYDAIRFVNWLHNGQGHGDTENGAYTLLGGTPTPSNGDSITRNTNAKWWLPSEDEWYKAAYHKNDGMTGNYWDYPTDANHAPNNNLPSADTGNSANFYFNGYTTGDASISYIMTDAGAYTLSSSAYGTFDQGGNVYEWNETFTRTIFDNSWRGIRGGSWGSFVASLHASNWSDNSSSGDSSTIGFRVASIPEPSSMSLGVLALLGMLSRRRRLVAATILASAAIVCQDAAQAITIDTVTIGNPGNAPDTRYDTTGFGSVGYVYQIGKHEITAGQYTEFPNASPATRPDPSARSARRSPRLFYCTAGRLEK